MLPVFAAGHGGVLSCRHPVGGGFVRRGYAEVEGEIVDSYHDVAQMRASLHDLEFGSGDDAQFSGDLGDVADVGARVVGKAAGLLGGADLGFDRLGSQGGLQGQFDGANRLFLA